MGFELMEHQKNALTMMEYNPYLGLFISPGGGKTAIALTWIKEHLEDGTIEDALVICPASLVDMWRGAIDDMIKFNGWNEQSVEAVRNAVAVISVARTYRAETKEITHRDGNVTKKKTYHLRDDIDKRWGAIFIDESHIIGSHSSVQSKTATTLSNLTEHRFIMTGTPVSGSSKDGADYSKLYGQVQFLMQGKAWRNWTDFCDKAITRFDRYYNPKSYNKPYCESIMKQCAIVARLEDFVDMPGFVETTMPCVLAEKKVYKDITKHCLEEYGLDETVAGTNFIRLLQVCSGSLKNDTETLSFKCSKDDVLHDILAGTDDAVVVFCNFRASVDRCIGICKKAGRKAIGYDGRSKKDDWKKFASGEYDTIVCQYQSGGAGLNLQNSSTMILFEPTLSTLNLEQAKGRIYRKGQERRCLYYYLSTPSTIESKTWDAVREGMDVTNMMLAQWASEE